DGVEIRARYVEAVEEVVAGPWRVDFSHLLRTEAGMRIETVVRIHQRAEAELVLEIVDVVLPRRLDLGHFRRDFLSLLLGLGELSAQVLLLLFESLRLLFHLLID